MKLHIDDLRAWCEDAPFGLLILDSESEAEHLTGTAWVTFEKMKKDAHGYSGKAEISRPAT